MILQRGQRIKLTDITNSLQLEINIKLTFPSAQEVDYSCFGLNAAQQLSDDRYFIFYNQPQSPEKAIVSHPALDAANFTVDLAKLPETIKRLVFVATLDDAATMHELRYGLWQLKVKGARSGNVYV